MTAAGGRRTAGEGAPQADGLADGIARLRRALRRGARVPRRNRGHDLGVVRRSIDAKADAEQAKQRH